MYFIDRALTTLVPQLASDSRTQLAEFQARFRAQHRGAASFASLTIDASLVVGKGAAGVHSADAGLQFQGQ